MFKDKEKQVKKEQSNLFFSLSIAGQLGWMIAVPVVVLALLGRFLDVKFESSPILLLVGILLSIMISSWIIYFKIIKVFTEIEKQTKQKNNETKKDV
ncbi:AtpZ/AtpI family protein [Patescibacteria group bacterium]|nr:AtpZ/AtpI family protein [Patescibacteria group bacterium]